MAIQKMNIKDNILVDYNDVVRCLTVSAFRYAINNPEQFPNFDFDKIKDLDEANLTRVALMRRENNPFIPFVRDDRPCSIGKCTEAVNSVFGLYPEICSDAPMLTFGENIFNLIYEKNVEKIIFYFPTANQQVLDDIINTYGNSDKLSFVFGDPCKFLELHPEVNTVITANKHFIQRIIDREASVIEHNECLEANNKKIDDYNQKVDEYNESLVDGKAMLKYKKLVEQPLLIKEGREFLLSGTRYNLYVPKDMHEPVPFIQHHENVKIEVSQFIPHNFTDANFTQEVDIYAEPPNFSSQASE